MASFNIELLIPYNVELSGVLNVRWSDLLGKFLMSEYLVEIICFECGNEEFFDPDSLPGEEEHCPYCSECSALLLLPNKEISGLSTGVISYFMEVVCK